MAGWRSTAISMSAKRPSTKGRIASRSKAPALARKTGALPADTQKWFDQNSTSRSRKPSSASRAWAKRAAASARKIRASARGSGLKGGTPPVMAVGSMAGTAMPFRLSRIALRSASAAKAARRSAAVPARPPASNASGDTRARSGFSSAARAPRGSEATRARSPGRAPRPKRFRAVTASIDRTTSSGALA